MFALLFLFLGVLFLLAAAGRIWIDPRPLSSRATDSTATDDLSDPGTVKKTSRVSDSVA